MKKRAFSLFSGLVALALVILCAAPFAYVILKSFAGEGSVTFLYYYKVFWGTSRYWVRFWRSMGICLCIAAGQLLVSVPAGYAFAKYRFPGRDLLFFLLMLLMILPVQVTLVPNYIVLGELGLLDSFASLILPSVFAPLGTFILRQSFSSIPDSLIDAAQLDGCGVITSLLKIAVPMNLSGVVCALLLSFLDAWNMVEQPIAYLKSFDRYPLSVALAYVPSTNATLQLVCCILTLLPPLFLFIYFNRELVEGITLAEEK